MHELQKKVQAVHLELNLKVDPITRLLTVVEELGELTKAVLKNCHYEIVGQHPCNEEIELESGDVLFDLLLFANLMGIDIELALDRTIEKMRKRFAEKGHPGSRE
jgi:NTP pyrophosphatase (non-canonical NTP hydrolase)